MTKKERTLLAKQHSLNMLMDKALGGATAGLTGFMNAIGYIDLNKLFKRNPEALQYILQDRHQLIKSIELLSRPLDIKKDRTLFYTGQER